METNDIKNLFASAREAELAEASQRQWRGWLRLKRDLFDQPERAMTMAERWAPRFLTLGALAAIALACGTAFWMPAFDVSSKVYANACQPDLYASTFYSSQAEADVVWISGLTSADDTTSNTP